MKILVYGTDKFQDYATFMRGLVVAIEDNITPADPRIEVYTAGPHKINNFTAEFVNRTEGFFKQKKIKTRFYTIKRSDALEKFLEYDFDHVISFNSKDDGRFFDTLMDKAENNKVRSSYYKY